MMGVRRIIFVARAVAGLSFGVAEGGFTFGLAASWHGRRRKDQHCFNASGIAQVFRQADKRASAVDVSTC
jgi:hypothetical protein